MHLEHFFDLTVEGDTTGGQTWTSTDGYEVKWERAAYSGDRQGLDRLMVRKGDQDLGDFFMYQDTDSETVAQILSLLAPVKQAAEVSGYLS
jgi:hypothetical protein